MTLDEITLASQLEATRHELQTVTQRANRLGKELVEIKGSLNEVAVYEGLVDSSPTAMLVAELVRDHAELEARVDAVLHYLNTDDFDGEAVAEVRRLLKGGKRIPDTPADLEGLE